MRTNSSWGMSAMSPSQICTSVTSTSISHRSSIEHGTYLFQDTGE